MVKSKTNVQAEERRHSARIAARARSAPVMEKKPAVKKALKAKKTKQAENGNNKAEEPKAEATDAK